MMMVYLFYQLYVGCIVFLGGIFKNYGMNLLFFLISFYMVIEVDEFDCLFYWLFFYMFVIIVIDLDYLDIYGIEQVYLESFEYYIILIQFGGVLIICKGIFLQLKVKEGVKMYIYLCDEGDFYVENICIGNGEIFIDFVGFDICIDNIQLGVLVSINIENGVVVMVFVYFNGVIFEEIKQGMVSFWGVDCWFDFKIKNNWIVFLSDYVYYLFEIK